MDYKEFVERIGKLSMPEQVPHELIDGFDSIHFFDTLGFFKDDGCVVTMSSFRMERFVEAIEALESRGAVRERDYAVVCFSDHKNYGLVLHASNKFLSDEDFDPSIKRYTK